MREIQLSNPTRRALSYAARLEGAADFSLEASLVKIDPGQSTQVQNLGGSDGAQACLPCLD